MTPFIASVLLPLLRRIDAETAHDFSLWALRQGLAGHGPRFDDPVLSTQALGLTFSNPIGLAAGFDKNAVAVEPLMRLGFGFIETGTVTPRPQAGNSKPRLYRLEPDRAVINRMGFNNDGLDAYVRNLAGLSQRPAILGANVGINKDGADPERDYPALIAAVGPLADYVTINVSSPNTPGLRDLQSEDRLRSILRAVALVPNKPPILVKVAPDLTDDGLKAVVETAVAEGVQGLIVGNTTLSRPAGITSRLIRKDGGLSGAPLLALSTRMLARAYLFAGGRLTLIGAGGVFNASDALLKIRAGASLVQLYTGFAYQGPALIPRLKRELADSLKKAGYSRVQDAVGSDARALAELG
jgi:dihydroorotate dehydrogenase